MKGKQAQKNCQSFMNSLYNCELYGVVRDLLLHWKSNDQLHIGAIDTFQKISALLQGENSDEILLQQFNRCLIKQISVSKINISVENLNFVDIRENCRPELVLTDIKDWIDEDKLKPPVFTEIVPVNPKPFISPPNKLPPPKIDIIKDSEFIQKILHTHKASFISKIIILYIKCIITQEEFKMLLHPLYYSDPALFYWLSKYAQTVKQKRYKRTIFSPLIDLVNYKYPFQLVGISYIMIPDGYANYPISAKRKNKQIESCINRKCCLVPLVGSQQQFFISPKTDSQREMFHLEDQGYQIDYTLTCIRACIKQIQNACRSCPITTRSYRLQNAMMKRVISELYPNDNVQTIFTKNIQLAKDVLLPRLKQKEAQLKNHRPKLIKVYSDSANKLFHKGLDYRYFHFSYNDKKYNSLNFWEKEISLRKKTVLQGYQQQNEEKIGDRKNEAEAMEEESESSFNEELKKQQKEEKEDNNKYGNKTQPSVFVRSRYEPVNTFDNVIGKLSQRNQEEQKKYDGILKEGRFCEEDFNLRVEKEAREMAETKLKTQQDYDHQLTASYPKFPDNQLLFIMDFSNSQIFNDVLEIFLYHCPTSKKRLFELLIFKMFRKNINARLPKFTNIIKNFENSPELLPTSKDNRNNMYEGLLNQSKENGSRQLSNYKNQDDEFMDMIEEDEQIAHLEELNIPFQLPKNRKYHSLIGTKIMYMLIRSILTLYQRFLQAKCYEQQFQDIPSQENSPNHYKKFLAILIHKLKDKKNFDESLRKVFNQDGYKFFTIDKIILGGIKFINSITNNQITYKILKDQTKDFEFQLFSWEKFPFWNITTQLYRLLEEKQKLFSFNYEPYDEKLYISCWLPPFHELKTNLPNRSKLIKQYLDEPIQEQYPHIPEILQKQNCEFLYTTITKSQQDSNNHKNSTIEDRTSQYRGESILINTKRWQINDHKIIETDLKKNQSFMVKYSCF